MHGFHTRGKTPGVHKMPLEIKCGLQYSGLPHEASIHRGLQIDSASPMCIWAQRDKCKVKLKFKNGGFREEIAGDKYRVLFWTNMIVVNTMIILKV